MKKLFTLFVLMAGCFAFAACSDDSGNDSNPGTDLPGENPGDSTLIEEKPEWINKPGAVSFMAEDVYQLWVYTFNIGDTLTIVDDEGNEWGLISEEKTVKRSDSDSTYICGFVELNLGSLYDNEKHETIIKGNIKEINVSGSWINGEYRDHKVSGIDISTCPYLEWFSCIGNNGSSALDKTCLTALIIGKNEALTYLNCRQQYLTSLDVSGCPNLETLDCDYNYLTSLDVSGCLNLIELSCDNNRLILLDVSGCPNLVNLDCYNNFLTELDVTKNVKLAELNCGNGTHFYNKLTSLDVSQNTELTTLRVRYNELSSLDLSKNTKLTYVSCEGNNFTDETMNELYNSLPEVGFNKYGEPMGELICDGLGDRSIATEKGWGF